VARLAARNRLRASWGRRATDISSEQLIRERDALGQAVRMLGVSVDVTERRESERLRAEAQRTVASASACCAA
jgi:hypothetical protein